MKRNILYLCKWVICVIFLTCICASCRSHLTELEFEIVMGVNLVICNIYGHWILDKIFDGNYENKIFEVNDET